MNEFGEITPMDIIEEVADYEIVYPEQQSEIIISLCQEIVRLSREIYILKEDLNLLL